MSHVYELAATRILDWLHRAERDLLGQAIVTFNSEAGTIKAVQLDDHHGLCFTMDEPPSRWYPVSTIRHRA